MQETSKYVLGGLGAVSRVGFSTGVHIYEKKKSKMGLQASTRKMGLQATRKMGLVTREKWAYIYGKNGLTSTRTFCGVLTPPTVGFWICVHIYKRKMGLQEKNGLIREKWAYKRKMGL